MHLWRFGKEKVEIEININGSCHNHVAFLIVLSYINYKFNNSWPVRQWVGVAVV